MVRGGQNSPLHLFALVISTADFHSCPLTDVPLRRFLFEIRGLERSFLHVPPNRTTNGGEEGVIIDPWRREECRLPSKQNLCIFSFHSWTTTSSVSQSTSRGPDFRYRLNAKTLNALRWASPIRGQSSSINFEYRWIQGTWQGSFLVSFFFLTEVSLRKLKWININCGQAT